MSNETKLDPGWPHYHHWESAGVRHSDAGITFIALFCQCLETMELEAPTVWQERTSSEAGGAGSITLRSLELYDPSVFSDLYGRPPRTKSGQWLLERSPIDKTEFGALLRRVIADIEDESVVSFTEAAAATPPSKKVAP